MTERWISQSEELLNVMEKLSSKKGKDRLETVNAIILALNAMDRSLRGWRSWIQSLSFMSKFTEDELNELEKGLTTRASAFLEYDIEVTKKHKKKAPRITVTLRTGKTREKPKGLYV